jgi:hypothetical protein
MNGEKRPDSGEEIFISPSKQIKARQEDARQRENQERDEWAGKHGIVRRKDETDVGYLGRIIEARGEMNRAYEIWGRSERIENLKTAEQEFQKILNREMTIEEARAINLKAKKTKSQEEPEKLF